MSTFIDATDSINDNVDNKEPLTLLSLSNNAIGPIIIVSKYLTIYDLSRLDVAYCNHEMRQELLDILSNNPFIVYDHISFDSYFKHIDNVLTWIGLRKINIISLNPGDGKMMNILLVRTNWISSALF